LPVARSQGDDLGGRDPGAPDGLTGGLELGLPDLQGVVFDEAGLGKVLGELLLGLRQRPALEVEDDGAAGSGSLV
jgi:hypothetical protein